MQSKEQAEQRTTALEHYLLVTVQLLDQLLGLLQLQPQLLGLPLVMPPRLVQLSHLTLHLQPVTCALVQCSMSHRAAMLRHC